MARVFLVLIGTSIIGLALIAVLAIIMWTAGVFGMLIALGLVAALGAAWGLLDERRLERQYKEDTQCSR